MNCYDCTGDGRTTPAVAICTSCGAALCGDHTRLETQDHTQAATPGNPSSPPHPRTHLHQLRQRPPHGRRLTRRPNHAPTPRAVGAPRPGKKRHPTPAYRGVHRPGLREPMSRNLLGANTYDNYMKRPDPWNSR